MNENKRYIESSLDALGRFQKIAFAAACCERMLPNYQVFYEAEHWGNPAVLREAIDLVWLYIASDEHQNDELRKLSKEFDKLIPDSEDFVSLHTSAATAAALAILETVKCCINKDICEAIDVADYSYDSIDLYLQFSGQVDIPKKVSAMKFRKIIEPVLVNHPLIQQELERQKCDLDLLASSEKLNKKVVGKLKNRSFGKSNIIIG